MEGLNRHPEIYPLRQWPGVHRASDAGLAGKGQHKIHPDIPLYNKQNCREWREIGRESLPSRIPIRGNKLYFTANSAAKAAAKAIRHQKQIVRWHSLNIRPEFFKHSSPLPHRFVLIAHQQRNAPQSLSKMILKAGSSVHCLRWLTTVSPSDAVVAGRAAVDIDDKAVACEAQKRTSGRTGTTRAAPSRDQVSIPRSHKMSSAWSEAGSEQASSPSGG
jgi:hypothetical protein